MTRPLLLALATSLVLACGPPLCRLDSEKVLRYAFPIAETGFDPAQISDLYSRTVAANIFEAPLTYDYLARPAQVKPQTAVALPEISDDGKRFVFRIRPGIYFADDPQFKSPALFQRESAKSDSGRGDPSAQAVAASFRGRKLPVVDRVEVGIVEEVQPLWLAFLNGERDLIERLPPEFATVAMPSNKLAPHPFMRDWRRYVDVDLKVSR